jgi:hypothetical protein
MLFGLLTRENLLPSQQLRDQATSNLRDISGARRAPRFGALIAFLHFARGAQREAFAAAPGRTAKAAMSTPP